MQKHHWIISKKHMYMLFFLRPSLSLCRLCTYTPGLLPAKRTLIRMTPGGPNQRRWGFHTSAHSQRRRLSWIRWTLQAFFSLWCQSVGVISGMWPGVNPSCHLFDIYIYTHIMIYIYICYLYSWGHSIFNLVFSLVFNRILDKNWIPLTHPSSFGRCSSSGMKASLMRAHRCMGLDTEWYDQRFL